MGAAPSSEEATERFLGSSRRPVLVKQIKPVHGAAASICERLGSAAWPDSHVWPIMAALHLARQQFPAGLGLHITASISVFGFVDNDGGQRIKEGRGGIKRII